MLFLIKCNWIGAQNYGVETFPWAYIFISQENNERARNFGTKTIPFISTLSFNSECIPWESFKQKQTL